MMLGMNEGMTCRVVHGQQLTNTFQVQTGVRQVITFPVPVGNRLGHDDIHSSEEQWHPVDTLDTVG